jgi:hypothetical protein
MLAQSQELFQDKTVRSNVYVRLEELYYVDSGTRFRHYYSDIFSALTQIRMYRQLGDINILGQNLSLIREGYCPKNRDCNGKLIDISESVKKLYDHVSLDIARISYSEAQDREVSGKESIENLQSRIKIFEKDISGTQKKLLHVTRKLESSQKEYIAILGIFSAVVLAFTAGIAFSTSVLENIHQSSIYRTVFVCCIIGIVLLNVIYLMFKFIENIVREKEKTTESKDYIPIIVINLLLIIVMLLTFFAWKNGWVEQRNIMLEESFNHTEVVEETQTTLEHVGKTVKS